MSVVKSNTYTTAGIKLVFLLISLDFLFNFSNKSIVANIKWGFPYPGRKINPRYISFYIGSESEISEDIKSTDFINKVKPKVLDYLHKNLYSGSNSNVKK